MYNIRRLQRRGNQWVINVPKDLVASNNWKKGAWLEVNPKGNYGIDVSQFREAEIPRTNVELEALKKREFQLLNIIQTQRTTLEPGTFSGYLGQFSYVQGRLRKLELVLNPRQ